MTSKIYHRLHLRRLLLPRRRCRCPMTYFSTPGRDRRLCPPISHLSIPTCPTTPTWPPSMPRLTRTFSTKTPISALPLYPPPCPLAMPNPDKQHPDSHCPDQARPPQLLTSQDYGAPICASPTHRWRSADTLPDELLPHPSEALTLVFFSPTRPAPPATTSSSYINLISRPLSLHLCRSELLPRPVRWTASATLLRAAPLPFWAGAPCTPGYTAEVLLLHLHPGADRASLTVMGTSLRDLV